MRYSQYLSQDRQTQPFPQAGHPDLLPNLVSAGSLAAALNLSPAQITCQQHFTIAIPYSMLIALRFCAYCSCQAIVLCDTAKGPRLRLNDSCKVNKAIDHMLKSSTNPGVTLLLELFLHNQN